MIETSKCLVDSEDIAYIPEIQYHPSLFYHEIGIPVESGSKVSHPILVSSDTCWAPIDNKCLFVSDHIIINVQNICYIENAAYYDTEINGAVSRLQRCAYE